MKKIGFLSFGHWSASPYSQVRSGADALIQSIELAEAVEDLGADGAYFRVHHFAQQLASPFPLLAAIGARTKRIEIGTAVIDMRYENPLYMVEDAGAADLIAGGRLQLGISRGSPEQVIDGFRYFGYEPAEGQTDADLARQHAEVFLQALSGAGFAQPNPSPMFPNPPGLLRPEPHSPGLRDRIWWGAGSRPTAEWAAQQGMNMQSSTLMTEDAGVPFHELQAEQIRLFREAWAAAGHEREPRVSVSRSIFALVDDRDRAYFGRGGQESDQVGYIDAQTKAIFGRSYAAEPDVLVKELAKDTAIQAADTLLLTVPNQLGVEYNMSSTLLTEDAGVPFDELQAEQIRLFHEAWTAAGHEREPRVSVSRSIFALVDDRDRAYFGRGGQDSDQVGYLDAQTKAIFGRSYAAEPDVLVKELAKDTAIQAADTLLLTVPNQLGVEYNAHAIESILKYVAPELGWR